MRTMGKFGGHILNSSWWGLIPWSRSKNDDIRNGMALCKLCHWAFDEGMMGVRQLRGHHLTPDRNRLEREPEGRPSYIHIPC